MIRRAALVLCLTAIAAWGGVAQRVEYQGVSFDTYTVDLALDPLAFYFKDGKTRYGNFAAVRDHLKQQRRKLLFAMNGGIFEPSHEPTGLYVEHGRELHPLNSESGPGNFFLKPNGVFLVSGRRGWIVESSRYPSLAKTTEISYALQSGPLLLGRGRLHPAFSAESTNTTVRNGVGIVSLGKVVFAISNEPVTFRHFALFFKEKMRCTDALYLDGTISRAYLPDLGRIELGGDFASIIAVADKS